jgi:hypothetical protein
MTHLKPEDDSRRAEYWVGEQMQLPGIPKIMLYEFSFVANLPDGSALFKKREGRIWTFWHADRKSFKKVYDENDETVMALFFAMDSLGYGRHMWWHIGEALGYVEHFKKMVRKNS